MANPDWYKIAESPAELQTASNGIAVVDVKGKKVCLARFNDQWYGFAYKCPHASGVMANGFIDATGNIVCPLHRYRFSLKDGRNTSGEGYFLKTYPVEARADGMYVSIDTGSGLFGWLGA